MKIEFHKGYVLVIWPWFVRLAGRITTGLRTAKGSAFFPFIFVLQKENPIWLITHERIHFRQQMETLFLGLTLLSFIERSYARLILRKNKMERYVYAASEQEAYLNMHDPEYLKKRRFGQVFWYVKNKREFKLIGPGQMEFLD